MVHRLCTSCRHEAWPMLVLATPSDRQVISVIGNWYPSYGSPRKVPTQAIDPCIPYTVCQDTTVALLLSTMSRIVRVMLCQARAQAFVVRRGSSNQCVFSCCYLWGEHTGETKRPARWTPDEPQCAAVVVTPLLSTVHDVTHLFGLLIYIVLLWNYCVKHYCGCVDVELITECGVREPQNCLTRCLILTAGKHITYQFHCVTHHIIRV